MAASKLYSIRQISFIIIIPEIQLVEAIYADEKFHMNKNISLLQKEELM